MSAPTPRVAVVGGGWAGLACAVELCAAGVPVCVFEAAKQLGGRARRVDIEGHALDNGQHLLLGAYRETLRVMRLSGADPERLLRRCPLELACPRDGFHLRLPRLPAPFNLAAGLLTAKGCPPGEKLAAVRFVRALQTSAYRLADDISVAALLDRHRQTGNLRRLLWEPLCLAALNTPPQHASAQIFANVLRDVLGGTRESSDLLLPRADLNRVFPDAAASFIAAHGGEIRRSARVGRIEQPLAIDGESFSHAVIATAPRQAAGLLREHTETRDIAALLDTYRFEPIGTVYLAYPDTLRLSFPMLGMSGPLGQWVFDRGQLGNVGGLMACVLSAQGAWDERDDASLAAALHGELRTTLARALPDPAWHRVIRERRATFSCRPGLLRPAAETALRGVWLAGDYVFADYPATLESAVRSGCHAARRILREADDG
ncbi:MAG: hydroxysqualene dehydroxylase HpnE [Candidatus Accumulibacter sp.]|jgi:squalene-associated FAD-dependent desaturase|nr:hydroxysqualene dehydroxylase HpnE [Accumulibacter sp.]